MRFLYILLFIPLVLCQCNKQENTKYDINRFDIALSKALENISDSTSNAFEKEYSNIFNIYYSSILKGNTDNLDSKSKIEFIASLFENSNFKKLYSDVQNEFKDMSYEEGALGNAMSKYSEIFEDTYRPTIYTHISPFGYSIITTDSFISISLDNYMGRDYDGYKDIYYNYQLPKRERSRIVPDVFKGWIYAKYPNKAKNLIEGMIYEGAVILAIENIVESHNADNIIGYDIEKAIWCRNNEKYIWNAMIKSNHLYSSDNIIYSKYMNEAPFCSVFNNSVPAEIGKWVGYKIVSKYIDKHGIKSIKKILEGEIPVVEILKLY